MQEVLIAPSKGGYAKREGGSEGERGTEGWMASRPLSPFQHPNTLPGEACQCLYCYLICKNGKIVCAVAAAAKKLINTGEKKIEERNLF